MSKKIGIENFRVFNEYTEFEIRPITLLTGPNNSGKSSFTKLLLLLSNGLERLDFENGSHNLEDFENVLSWESSKSIITINLKNPISFLSKEYYLKLEYEKSELLTIEILSSSNSFIKIDFFNKTHHQSGYEPPIRIKFNIDILIDLIYDENLILNFYRIENIDQISEGFNIVSQVQDFKDLRSIENNIKEYESLNFDSLISTIKKTVEPEFNDGKIEELRNISIKNEIKSLNKDYLLFNVYSDGKCLNDIYPEYMKEIQDEIFEEIIFQIVVYHNIDLKDKTSVLNEVFSEFYFRIKSNLKNKIGQNLGYKSVVIEETSLGRLIFKEKLFRVTLNEKIFKNTLIEEIKEISFSINEYLSKMDYISANRGNQKRVLMNSSDSEIDKIVLEFSKIPKPEQYLNFLSASLDIFEIEGKLEVKRYENFISVITLNRKNQKITLSDVGYGYSQIIPIILKIILLNENSNTEQTIIIEEPEANLHPSLQSKFADFLKICLNEFPKINFIIETHSEYLIRKLQYLIGTNKISSEDAIIYYFNLDKHVNSKEPKVKIIEINKEGNLTDTFGPGFFDEATRLQFNLLKLNREQKN